MRFRLLLLSSQAIYSMSSAMESSFLPRMIIFPLSAKTSFDFFCGVVVARGDSLVSLFIALSSPSPLGLLVEEQTGEWILLFA